MSRPFRFAAGLILAAGLAACPRSGGEKASGPLLHVPSPAWEDQVVYFVMTDRFANGDPGNDDQGAGEFDPANGGKYSGGDLRGIIDRLDYIQGLGATAVWITPPVANLWWDPISSYGGYHGYWARHLKRVDEHLGTLEDYRALSDALHRRGMYLIQDVVPNHMGNFFTYGTSCPACYDPACVADWTAPACDPTAGFVSNVDARPGSAPEQAPFDQVDVTDPTHRQAAIYHWTPPIADYNSEYQQFNYQTSDLDDLNSENPVVRTALRDSYGYWVREVGVDAFRVDTAKFAPPEFWADFFHATDAAAPGILEVARATGRTDFLAFGEIFEISEPGQDAAERKMATFLETAGGQPALPDTLQFPLYAELKRVFAGGDPTAQLSYRLGKFMDPALFPNPHRTPTFLDNHDVDRFLRAGTKEALSQALAFLFTVPGIPIVYQGTEQAYAETRMAMFAGGHAPCSDAGCTPVLAADQFNTFAPGYQNLKALAALRKGSRALTRGDVQVRYDNPASAGGLAYTRTSGAETVLVLMNTSDQEALLSGVPTGFTPGTTLQVLHAANLSPAPAAPSVGADGKLTTRLARRGVLVLRGTGTTVTPPPPAATITVATPLEGQTFAQDVTIIGTVSPASTALRLVLDDDLSTALPVTVAADGSWSVVLPVSDLPDGLAAHHLAIWAPGAGVSTDLFRFRTDVVFVGVSLDVDDPAGDDAGPLGTYAYPTDATYDHEMDIVHVKAEVGAKQLRLHFTMRDWSTEWGPPNKFDHVAFSVFFEVPGQAGQTVLPKLNASAPQGFAWSLDQFTFGWANAMYTAAGADAGHYGTPAKAAAIRADAATRTVTFTYNRTAYGIPTWSGVRVYATTWDFDGIDNVFRQIYAAPAQWRMSGGTVACETPDTKPQGCDDPKIMDDVPVITLP